MKCMHVTVEGRVQGVAYRAWAERTARQLSLSGWVRNRNDGLVEAVFCGDDEDVGAMLELCRLGPPAAYVRQVTSEPFTGEAPAQGLFRVLATA